MDTKLTNRGLLRAVLVAFALFLAYRFVAAVAATALGPVVGWTLRFFPPEKTDDTRELLYKVRASLISWLGGRLFSMAVVGTLSIGALYLIGIPGALFLGVFTGLVCFIPLIGPVISAVPPRLTATPRTPPA
jgi:hypothetical protein